MCSSDLQADLDPPIRGQCAIARLQREIGNRGIGRWSGPDGVLFSRERNVEGWLPRLRELFPFRAALPGEIVWRNSRTEHLVIASIGKPIHTLNDAKDGTLLRAKIREHSRKPDEFAEMLSKHCSGPFLELFAREPREGWTTWGAETDKFVESAAA